MAARYLRHPPCGTRRHAVPRGARGAGWEHDAVLLQERCQIDISAPAGVPRAQRLPGGHSGRIEPRVRQGWMSFVSRERVSRHLVSQYMSGQDAQAHVSWTWKTTFNVPLVKFRKQFKAASRGLHIKTIVKHRDRLIRDEWVDVFDGKDTAAVRTRYEEERAWGGYEIPNLRGPSEKTVQDPEEPVWFGVHYTGRRWDGAGRLRPHSYGCGFTATSL